MEQLPLRPGGWKNSLKLQIWLGEDALGLANASNLTADAREAAGLFFSARQPKLLVRLRVLALVGANLGSSARVCGTVASWLAPQR